jgi:hypothetical protein
VLLAALVAACSSGGDGERGAMTKAEARAVVARAQLSEADLGAGWTKKSDEAGTTSGGDELERCAKAVEVTDDTLVPPRTRSFEHAVDDRNVQQVVGTTAVLRSTGDVRRLLRAAGNASFARCFAEAAAAGLVDAANGVDAVAGKAAVTTRSGRVRIVAPVELHLDAETEPVRLDVLLLGRGQTLWVVAGFSLGAPLPEEVVPHLGDVLLTRQRAA